MFNLDRERIDVECPRCHFPARVFLRQVRLCDVIVCGGCKGNIQLIDHMATFRKANRRITAALGSLMSALSDLGR
jgi:predicted metal-binding protein